jgi:hypothetical protein
MKTPVRNPTSDNAYIMTMAIIMVVDMVTMMMMRHYDVIVGGHSILEALKRNSALTKSLMRRGLKLWHGFHADVGSRGGANFLYKKGKGRE